MTTNMIDTFKSRITEGGGLAMANLYRVFLPPIIGVRTQDMDILCKAAQIPGRQILSTERFMGMTTMKVANGYASDDVTLTFYCLNDMRIIDYFHAWQSKAVNQEEQEVGYLNDYTYPVIIQALKKGAENPLLQPKKLFDNKLPDALKDAIPPIGPLDLANGTFDLGLLGDTGLRYMAEGVTYSCRLDKAYPTTINSFEMSNELDGLLEVNVQLSYKNFRIVEGNLKDRIIDKAIDVVGEKVKDKLKDKMLGGFTSTLIDRL